MTISERKIFDGKIYNRFLSFDSKTDAKRQAKKLRSLGHFVRITKSTDRYMYGPSTFRRIGKVFSKPVVSYILWVRRTIQPSEAMKI
jgi:hypothetical protein